jgi:hypothetical protein
MRDGAAVDMQQEEGQEQIMRMNTASFVTYYRCLI